MPDDGIQELTKEVAAIRKLIILALQRFGASQAEIAKALGVNQSSISRMFGAARGIKQKRR